MYRMSWVKYGNGRKWSYSHKQVTAALAEIGWEVKIAPKPGATMIAYVDIQTAQDCKVVADRLNLVCPNFPYFFKRIIK